MTSSIIFAASVPEFDLGQVVIVIMLLLGGFFQSLMNWWKKKRAEAELMRQKPATPEELEARAQAWREQTGAEERVPQQPVAGNILDEIVKAFRQITEPEIAVAPPPLPPQPIHRVVPVIEVPRVDLPPAKLPSAAPAIVQHRPRHPLAEKLTAIGGLRQAVVLREIIGLPKALQSTDDHLI